MPPLVEEDVRILAGDTEVSGLFLAPVHARTCFVLAHGAGAGMRHSFMDAVAFGLAARSIATLRYQFPYMEQGTRRPDSPGVAKATVRAAVAKTRELLPGLPLVAGGKSYGGRMTSQAQSERPLDGVRGLVFLGFPLHARGQPSDARAQHLSDVAIPMLFLQGTRDELADLAYLQPLLKRLGARAALKLFEYADHSFHMPAKSGRTDAQTMTELLDSSAEWIAERTAN